MIWSPAGVQVRDVCLRKDAGIEKLRVSGESCTMNVTVVAPCAAAHSHLGICGVSNLIFLNDLNIWIPFPSLVDSWHLWWRLWPRRPDCFNSVRCYSSFLDGYQLRRICSWFILIFVFILGLTGVSSSFLTNLWSFGCLCLAR